MKIAIQGHPTRGKEVIQILESLGGKNVSNYSGKDNCVHYIGIHNYICRTSLLFSKDKYYTLEEFEKDFPFKIGEKIKHITSIGIIKEYCYVNNEPAYKVESMELGIIATIPAKILEPYKGMEIRNITLTLDKAKEWYKKGGELKEIALQAYSEEELTKVELPKTWEEFCDNYMIDDSEAYFDTCGEVYIADKTCRHSLYDRNVCPSKESAEAHLAMIQLEQLRNCWWNGWEPIWDCSGKWSIGLWGNELSIGVITNTSKFLTFPTKEMAEEFLECFRDLIEKARNLI